MPTDGPPKSDGTPAPVTRKGAGVPSASWGVGLGLPGWARDLSPFAHVPAVPASTMAWTPVVVLSALAVALLVLGGVGLRHRDIG